MRKHALSIVIALLCCVMCKPGAMAATGVKFDHIDSEAKWMAVKAQSENKSKPIFIDFYTSWCGYCKKMDAEVFSDKAVAKYLGKNFITVKVNAEEPWGQWLVGEYKVKGFPGFVFLHPDGAVLSKQEGYLPTPYLMAISQEMVAVVEELPDLEKAFDQGELDQLQQMRHALLLDHVDAHRASQLAKTLLPAIPNDQLLDNAHKHFVNNFADQLTVAAQQHIFRIASNDEDFAEEHGLFLIKLLDIALQHAIQYQDSAYLAEFLDKGMPLVVPSGALIEAKHLVWLEFYQGTADWKGFSLRIIEHMEKETVHNFENLTKNALLIAVHNQDTAILSHAKQWAKQAMNLKESPESLFVYAFVHYQSGEAETAMTYAQNALTLAEADQSEFPLAVELIHKIQDRDYEMKE